MRINVTMILMTIFLLKVSASDSFAQKVTLNRNNASLKEIFAEIKKQTGYSVLYKSTIIKNAKPVTVVLSNVQLEEAMSKILFGQNLDFSIDDRAIVIKEREKPIPERSKIFFTEEKASIPPLQNETRGSITDSLGNALQGASVWVLNAEGLPTTLQTSTGENGEFVLRNVPADALLLISYVGYEPYRIRATANLGNIILRTVSAQLEEVELTYSTGYQNIRPEHSTGAISQLSTKEYESRISTNFLDGLVNRMPGLMINNQVQFTSTSPDGSTSSRPLFNIRGISTMSANQQPLIVVDGYPTELTLNMIDPNEIQSVTLLKDAAAATVYGVRASNGVIVIERKQAALGKPKFSFRATAGIIPEENYSRYRWEKDASATVIDYERTVLAGSINSNSWAQLATPAVGSGGARSRSPVYYILAQAAANMITPEQAERSFAEMAAYDNREDYQRLFTRPAVTQTYNFNVSGGNNNALYYITANYTGDQLSAVENNNDRFLLSARSTLKLGERLSLELTTDYQEQRFNRPPVPGVASTYPFERFQDPSGNPAFILSSSIAPSYNAVMMSQGLDDHLYYPLVDLAHISDKYRTANNRITANFTYDIGAGFDLLFGGIYETSRSENRYYAAEESSVARRYTNSYVVRNPDGTLRYYIPKGGYLRHDAGSVSSYTARTQLNYNKLLGGAHSINGIIGAEVRNLVNTGNRSSYFGYNDETLLHQPVDYASIIARDIQGSYQLGSPFHQGSNPLNALSSQQYTEDRFVSGYTNLVYSYKDTYSLSGSIRVDQSNLFGTNPRYKYKPLWSAGAAWNIHREDFMHEVDWVKQLKLRVAYGFNGNVAKMSLPQVIASANFNYYTFPYIPSLTPLAYANSSLRWEQTQNFNAGLDYHIFKNITGNIDYYNKRSTDLLSRALIDPTIGRSPSLINQATIDNNGIEIGIRADWISTQKLNWNTGMVIARNTSKVLEVYQRSDYHVGNLNTLGFVEDYPVGALFTYRYAGLDDAGFPLIEDTEGTVYHTSDNSTVALMISNTSGVITSMGSAIPTLNAGLSNRVDFGNFYVFCMIHYYGGFNVLVPRPNPSSSRPLEGAGTFWRAPGDEVTTDVMSLAGFASTIGAPQIAYNYADRYVVNGDYITLGDLTVSYRIDHLHFIKRAGFTNFEVKGQASNIWTLGLNRYNYSMATGSYQKSYVTPTYTIGIFTNF